MKDIVIKIINSPIYRKNTVRRSQPIRWRVLNSFFRNWRDRRIKVIRNNVAASPLRMNDAFNKFSILKMTFRISLAVSDGISGWRLKCWLYLPLRIVLSLKLLENISTDEMGRFCFSSWKWNWSIFKSVISM